MSNADTLHTTKYEGVYYKKLKNTVGTKSDISYYVIYRTNGKQKKKSVGKKSQKMTAAKANQIRNDILYEIKHGLNEHNQKELTFGYLKDKWYEDKKAKLKSIKEDTQRLDNYCNHLFDRKLMSISAKDIKDIYIKMINKGLSEQTFKKTYSMIKRVINHALEHDYIKTAPIIKLNLSIKDKKTTETYTDEMIKKYVSVIDNYEDQLISKIVKLIFCTGMRRAEPLKIKWEHYSKENSTVKVVDAKSGDDEIYYLSNSAIELIESQKELSQEYIFEERPGVPIGTSRLSYHANKMKLKAGLPDNYRPLHSLRHHFGTQLARHGLNAFKIQKMMTHKDIKTTQRYIDLADKEIVDELNIIDKKLTIN
ncbi:tyrosine-type recombinase/integrase [Arcobacter arenosus]|uniref:tyrosine-type recombinase/integrase n=1 Tax=Arcobacter arenosus TaxID=2576037 RepID=UPI003BAD65FF